MANTAARVWCWGPQWYWYGLRTLWPLYLGGDEYGRRTVVLGWTVTGRIIVAISRVGALYPPDAEVDHGCCALDDAAGSGHDGPCGWLCGTCGGGGRCPVCDGWGDDAAVCRECGGSGACPDGCDDGWRYDE